MRTDSSFFFTAALLVGLASTARAQPLEYEIRFDNADHHEAEVRLRLESVPLGTLELRMSRSSPGRYALHEFAKNVYDVRVIDGRGREIEPSRPDPVGSRYSCGFPMVETEQPRQAVHGTEWRSLDR